MGERFRLKASVDISAYPPDDRVILQALKDYGMIVADIGSPWYLSGAPSSSWSDADLHLLGQLNGSDFEAVNLAPVVTGVTPASGQATGGASVLINGLDFGGAAGMLHVSFGGVDAGAVQVVSDTQLRVTAPAGAGVHGGRGRQRPLRRVRQDGGGPLHLPRRLGPIRCSCWGPTAH